MLFYSTKKNKASYKWQKNNNRKINAETEQKNPKQNNYLQSGPMWAYSRSYLPR